VAPCNDVAGLRALCVLCARQMVSRMDSHVSITLTDLLPLFLVKMNGTEM